MEASLLCSAEHFLLPWPTLPWVQQQAAHLFYAQLVPLGNLLPVPPLPPEAVTALGREGTEGKDRLRCSKRMCTAKHSLPGQTVGLLVLSASFPSLHGAQGAASCVCPTGNP